MDGLEGFEFFEIILNSSSRLRLPDKFTRVLLDGGKPREVKLREAGSGRRSLWDVVVVLDADGHMYLGRGWEQFARAHDLRLGYFRLFSYDGDAVLTIKVFDGSMCRRHFQHDDDTSSGSGSDSGSSDGDTLTRNRLSPRFINKANSDGDSSDSHSGGSRSSTAEMDVEDGPTSQFSVMLRKCNLGAKQEQYLNVPVEFQLAHGYAERSMVVLRMSGGKSWPVHLKHNPKTGGRPRASFRYGWHQFCVDNALGEGDTCFFRALRQGSASRGGEDHLLKVEVRKRDGSFLD